jgi:hypothetical protein
MPRVFVAVLENQEGYIQMTEDLGVEAIPLTSDSVIDNIRSLETCSLVLVDATTPSWVVREINEHHKMAVGVRSVPEGVRVTGLIDSLEKFADLMVLLRPVADGLSPADEDYIRRVATVRALFPAPRYAL